MDLLCVLAVWFTNVILLSIVVFLLFKLNKNIDQRFELELLKFNIDHEPKDTDFQIIDNLIQENLAEYRVLKLENVEKLYITETMQTTIFEYILRKVMYQLSPMYLQKLYYIYNKDKVDEVITQKINMHILEYTIEVNSRR